MSHILAEAYLADLRQQARQYKSMAEKALAQVEDDALFATLDAEANSLAILLQHVGGNLRSRWTDFLTTDGEKPDRHRDDEFEAVPGTTRATLMARWEAGWQCFFGTLDALGTDDLLRTITIRQQPLTVVQALHRSLLHTAAHVGQMVLLAKHFAGPAWQTLSIPRGQSETFVPR
jgi:hypothetical protein